jgi:tRNA(His) guanylyltransferase
MINGTLRDRIESYISHTDQKLLARLPIIYVLNGRNFQKTTQLLEKPYNEKFAECMLSTMLQLCLNIEGVMFSYSFNDNIILISRNDKNDNSVPWCDNRIQKIASITASIATSHFQKCAAKLSLNLTGDCLFSSQVFEAPNISEAINAFIFYQQQNNYLAIQSACLYNLLTKYNKEEIKSMLQGLTIDEKIDLLSQECQINFNDYSLTFRRGAAAYKVPKIIDGEMKNKWHLNTELPIFTQNQAFLSNLFKMGSDIFRVDENQ